MGIENGKKGKQADGFQGLTSTPEWRKHMSDLFSGIPKPVDMVRKMSSTWRTIRPLFARGALIGDVEVITGFSRSQIKSSLHKKTRPSWFRLPDEFYTVESQRERLRRAHKGVPRRLKDRTPPTDNEIKAASFAKKLLDLELIEDDLENWQRLNYLYHKEGRQLSGNLSDRLRLEFFLVSALHARRGDKTLLKTYETIGTEIDERWFHTSLLNEEAFIIVNTRPQEKRIGRFRELVEFLGPGENSRIIFDSKDQQRARALNRERVRRGTTS